MTFLGSGSKNLNYNLPAEPESQKGFRRIAKASAGQRAGEQFFAASAPLSHADTSAAPQWSCKWRVGEGRGSPARTAGMTSILTWRSEREGGFLSARSQRRLQAKTGRNGGINEGKNK
jgi:hypothetical protein